MFITSKYSGYNRHGEQIAAGLFLILTQPKSDSKLFPSHADTCSDCGRTRLDHEAPLPSEVQAIADRLHNAWMHLFVQRTESDSETIKDACEVILDAKRQVTGCTYFRAKAITYPIRAIVRHVSMKQLGHFMMGSARVSGARLTLSGAYGSDGLPDSVPDDVYAKHGLELPANLYEAWNNGGGWNGSRGEAPLMRKWALDNLAALRK